MKNPIKSYVQQKIYSKCYDDYKREVERQSDRYAQLLISRGEITSVSKEEQTVSAGSGSLPDKSYALQETKETIVVYLTDGVVDKEAYASLDKAFVEYPELLLAYGHEDFLRENGERHSPWCKPEWSPDTLQTSFYFGSLFAVRKQLFEEWKQEQKDIISNVSDLHAGSLTISYTQMGRSLAAYILQKKGVILSNDEKKPVRVLDAFLYHRMLPEEQADAWLPEDDTNDEVSSDWITDGSNEAPNEGAISVIIPSKDNPAVLRTCIESIYRSTSDAGVIAEIIVIDNGSNEINRNELERMAKELSFRYHYEPMEFNFSVMCNRGAAIATGKYLLFLNDDMEIVQPDWLQRMYAAASGEHAGAAGAKLLYPDTDLIQHAGVTNLKVGPAHKLLKRSDSQVYYHGRNRGRHNMLAVTAACLLVSKEKFQAVGGFYEGMAVSYNDVDLCFSLYEKGWYNIQCNDVVLYHHESLSRGDDNLSEAKWERLLNEKQTLYNRHPKLKKQDPYYSPLLAGHFSDYLCGYEYEYERRDCYTGISDYHMEFIQRLKQFIKAKGKWKGLPLIPEQWYNECLVVNVEHARRERKLDLTEEQEVWWIEGWAYVLGMDNCCYDKTLLLKDEKNNRFYRAETLTRYRKDVEEILPQQKNVALSGFMARIIKQQLLPGHYRITMLAKDKRSGQRLYRETDTILSVE